MVGQQQRENLPHRYNFPLKICDSPLGTISAFIRTHQMLLKML